MWVLTAVFGCTRGFGVKGERRFSIFSETEELTQGKNRLKYIFDDLLDVCNAKCECT